MDVYESIVFQPFVDWKLNVFAVDIRINFRRNLPPVAYAYSEVSKNPHRAIEVSVWGEYGSLCDNSKLSWDAGKEMEELMADQSLHRRGFEKDSGSIFELNPMTFPLDDTKPVTYRATIKSISQGKPYIIVIDARHSLGQMLFLRPKEVVVKFRLVWVRVLCLKASF